MMACVKQSGSFSCHTFDDPDDYGLGDQVLAVGHSLPILHILIDDVDNWVLLPLLAWFIDIWVDSDITAGMYLHPRSHGIHILFQG